MFIKKFFECSEMSGDIFFKAGEIVNSSKSNPSNSLSYEKLLNKERKQASSISISIRSAIFCFSQGNPPLSQWY